MHSVCPKTNGKGVALGNHHSFSSIHISICLHKHRIKLAAMRYILECNWRDLRAEKVAGYCICLWLNRKAV